MDKQRKAVQKNKDFRENLFSLYLNISIENKELELFTEKQNLRTNL